MAPLPSLPHFFQAAPLKSLSCPYCLGNRNLPTNDGFDKWVPDAAFPQVHPNRSQSGTLPESTHNTRRPVLQLFLAWWQPYHAAIERFLVKIWPISLFTFTEEERRALRLATRGTYRFSQINDPRLAKWLIHRGGPSAVGGLETIQPEIARHLVKTSGSLRFDSIQYIDEQLAQCLSQHNGRTLYLDNLHHIDLEVLQILIRHGGRGLSLGGIKNISLQEASVLATYRGRLSLNKLDNPNSEILAALVQHTGKSMSLGSLNTLSRPQAQQLNKYRGDLYLRGIQELPPGIDAEFRDFPQKIVLMHHERRPNQPYNTVKDPTEGAPSTHCTWDLSSRVHGCAFRSTCGFLGQILAKVKRWMPLPDQFWRKPKTPVSSSSVTSIFRRKDQFLDSCHINIKRFCFSGPNNW